MKRMRCGGGFMRCRMRSMKNALRKYESENYEVVKVEIEMDGGKKVKGLTF
jgi:hypothetical protein